MSLFTPLYMCLCSPHFTCVFVHPTLHVSLFTPLYMCLCSPHFTCVFVHPTLHVSLFTPLYMCLCSHHFTCVFVHPTLHVSLFTPRYMCLCSPHFQKSLKAVGAFFLAGTGEVNSNILHREIEKTCHGLTYKGISITHPQNIAVLLIVVLFVWLMS